MKKKLEAELMSIAHRILKLKGREDILKMHLEVANLYEKLSVFKFVLEHEDEALILSQLTDENLTEIKKESVVQLNEKSSDFNFENFSSTVDFIKKSEENTHEIKEEINEEIQIKEETKEELNFLDSISEKKELKSDEMPFGYEELPVFEPISNVVLEKKSLNEKLKYGAFKIGLNDKIIIIKHLFDGNADDYNRVLSTINTLDSFNEAKQFIETMIKPDYNQWVSKEQFESRFMELVEDRFN